MSKPCPSDKIYNKDSKRCVLKSGKIGKAILNGTYVNKNKKIKEKQVGQIKKKQVDKTKQSEKKKECPSDKVYNEKTKRCVSKTGKIGKAILSGSVLPVKKATSKSTKEKQQLAKQKQVQRKQQQKVPKDVQILDYAIGTPVSKSQALKNFLCPEVKVKKQQLTSDGLYLDPITLQELPVKDLVQLKETGEIMSRESFEEYINNNTTTWCGKQSVGFKSPDGTIFGNLVRFNYNPHEGFCPQKNGTLFIQLTDYNKFFKLEYKNYRFYLPNTKDGKLVLCMMKDAFKKGNLFAFTKGGHIRHGRIHKKTSLHGTYGFPDAGYTARVLGELNLLGSSPYIYQYSNDKNCDIGTDPYPEEKRWKIQMK